MRFAGMQVVHMQLLMHLGVSQLLDEHVEFVPAVSQSQNIH